MPKPAAVAGEAHVVAKADNVISATHTKWKCLILLPMKCAIGVILPSNLWLIISAISAIAGCIVRCLRARFATGSMPRFLTKGIDFDALLKIFRETIIPFSRQNAHPRMFGYVQSPGTPVAAFADLLASTLNANLTVWRSAPAPVEMERLTIDWIRQILGFNAEAGGLFVSGGSMANLAAIAAARQAKDHSSGRLRIYASSETHFSIAKAAALLGIGRENVRHVPVDDHFRIRVDDLVAKITADLEAGNVPFCVVANAGTVNTGAVDPLAEIREIADRFKLWMHVDGSYGAFAVLAKSARELFAGIERADSVALDPHKWLYLPVDVGCVIYRDPEIARAAFAHEAEYTRIIGEEADEAFAFWDYGPELSRRFRALKVWMLLKGVGLDALSEAIESNLACARYFESMVQASDDFEMAHRSSSRSSAFVMCRQSSERNRQRQSMLSMNAC